MEDLNNILASGIVPGLFPEDEIGAVLDGVRDAAVKDGIVEQRDQLWSYFISTVRQNLHVVLAFSPIGANFRNRCRFYPAFVNCTTIDKFFEWPADALQEVANRFMEEVEIASSESGVDIKSKLAPMFALAHSAVSASRTAHAR